MAQEFSVGLDIGTETIKAVAVSPGPNNGTGVVGVGHSGSAGIKNGYVTDKPEAADSITEAVARVGDDAGADIERVSLAISDESLSTRLVADSVTFDNPDHQITESDVHQATNRAEEKFHSNHQNNYTVLHQFPTAFKVDGRSTLSRPEGLHGKNLAVNTLFVNALSKHVFDLVEATESAGVRVENVVAGPLADSRVSLTGAQKRAGCIIANIGAETTSVAIFDDGSPVSMTVLPVGSSNITNDIALGLKIPLEEAEKLKCGSVNIRRQKKSQLKEITTARLEEILESISDHVEKTTQGRMLPAGIIFCGGGTSLSKVEETAKKTLSIPAKVAKLDLPNTKTVRELENQAWSSALGAADFRPQTENDRLMGNLQSYTAGLLDWLKQFLP
jgi:cell division protein FtsA